MINVVVQNLGRGLEWCHILHKIYKTYYRLLWLKKYLLLLCSAADSGKEHRDTYCSFQLSLGDFFQKVVNQLDIIKAIC